MLVTFTNIYSDIVHVSMLTTTIQPGLAIVARRTAAQIEAEYQLADLVAEGKISLSFVAEPNDGLITAPGLLPTYTTAELPDPTTLAPGTCVWNTDDSAPIYSDGTAWRDAAGILT